MSALYTPTGWLGDIIVGLTAMTGDQYLTYFILLLIYVFILLCLFKLEMEWVAIAVQGLILSLLAFSSDWLAFAGMIIIYFALRASTRWMTD